MMSDSADSDSPLLVDEGLLSLLLQHSRENTLPAHLAATLEAISVELARSNAKVARLRACVKDQQATSLRQTRDLLHRIDEAARSLVTPIRRLPAELLLLIFRQHWVQFEAECEEMDVDAFDPIHAGVSRHLMLLALAPFLSLSQVCSRWHTLVVDTAEIWSEVHLDASIWLKPEDGDKAMHILHMGLERSRDVPLFVSVTNTDNADLFSTEALELLGTMAHRWRTARFICFRENILSCNVLHQLLQLRTLEVIILGEDAPFDLPKCLLDAPRLKTLSWGRQLLFPGLALEQLSDARASNVTLEDLPTIIGHFSRLSGVATLRLHLFSVASFVIMLPPVSSNIRKLSLVTAFEFDPATYTIVAGAVLSCLTLPLLESFEFGCSGYPYEVLPWAHTAFLGLAVRSSFKTHLRRLELLPVWITAAELFEVLSALERLEALSIADAFPSEEGLQRPVILDEQNLAALSRLASNTTTTTMTSHSHLLVPHLESFYYASRMEFSPAEFCHFVHSRASVPRTKPFHVRLEWFRTDADSPNTASEIAEFMRAQLESLTAAGKLHFGFDVAEPNLWSLGLGSS
ncbi:hypothetical protein C8F01DRAFT_1169220 [Mycena amicta]|nr:hypothetical protein C8F01DRAFT_1169220 [Mycena amicta]